MIYDIPSKPDQKILDTAKGAGELLGKCRYGAVLGGGPITTHPLIDIRLGLSDDRIASVCDRARRHLTPKEIKELRACLMATAPHVGDWWVRQCFVFSELAAEV